MLWEDSSMVHMLCVGPASVGHGFGLLAAPA